MNVNEYRSSKLATRVTSDITERWQTRVVANGWHTMGADGARRYLSAYGKSIKAPKCVKFAIHAESQGAMDFATAMWTEAFELETGQRQSPTLDPDAIVPGKRVAAGLPDHLQPGVIATAQPQDLEDSLEMYIKDKRFIAQEKIDGMRMVAVIDGGRMWYQTRNLNLFLAPLEIEATLNAAFRDRTAVLDGELTWLCEDETLHRTEAQALTHGQADPLYIVFDCLHDGKEDLRGAPYWYREERLMELPIEIYTDLTYDSVSVLMSSELVGEKRKLLKHVKSFDREGVVFRDRNAPYTPGKKGTMYRHKFLMEHVLDVISLTPTKATDRLFGAIETPIGLVGTGFGLEDQIAIRKAFDAGNLKIEVLSQGLTESGKLWHARYKGIA